LAGHPGRGPTRPDVVLGDRWGASAAPAVVEAVEAVFREHGFVVARNAPFAGAYVAQRYGQPSRGMHAVQIEIDRALYLDEATIEPLPRFDAFRALMHSVVKGLAAIDPGQGFAGGVLDLAAE
jgi:N-formylglutamate amidohydrolase